MLTLKIHVKKMLTLSNALLVSIRLVIGVVCLYLSITFFLFGLVETGHAREAAALRVV